MCIRPHLVLKGEWLIQVNEIDYPARLHKYRGNSRYVSFWYFRLFRSYFSLSTSYNSYLPIIICNFFHFCSCNRRSFETGIFIFDFLKLHPIRA